MEIICQRCGKHTKHLQICNGKKVCADDRNCWPMEKKYTPPAHLVKQLERLQARWAQ